MSMMELFKKHKSIGVVGGVSSGKSMFCLTQLIQIKKRVKIDVYCIGVESKIIPYLEENGIKIIYSSEDILDLKIRDSLIFIDEFGDIFNIENKGREYRKIKRFFNRIAHLNNFVIITSAQTKFWNTFICSLVRAFVVKSVEFIDLVNGTILKDRIQSLEKTSDYRLDIEAKDYYIVDNKSITQKKTFRYDKHLDSKKDLVNPFLSKKSDKKKNKPAL